MLYKTLGHFQNWSRLVYGVMGLLYSQSLNPRRHSPLRHPRRAAQGETPWRFQSKGRRAKWKKNQRIALDGQSRLVARFLTLCQILTQL